VKLPDAFCGKLDAGKGTHTRKIQFQQQGKDLPPLTGIFKMITDASQFFNLVLADVEWQNTMTDGQRRIALNFAYEWLADALNSGTDAERECTRVREGLRRIANFDV
jgi:hypothetical protein